MCRTPGGPVVSFALDPVELVIAAGDPERNNEHIPFVCMLLLKGAPTCGVKRFRIRSRNPGWRPVYNSSTRRSLTERSTQINTTLPSARSSSVRKSSR
jgi:hypothetical protein